MGAEPFIGEISIFAGNYAPVNWQFCDGTLLSIAEYQALFSVIGTSFGGDGQTTFAVPDLRGRAAMGTGTGPGLTPRTIGESQGAESVTLLTANLPAHTHNTNVELIAGVGAITDAGSVSSPANGAVLASGYDVQVKTAINNYTSTTGATVTLGGATATAQATFATAGLGGPHNNMMPFTAINYIIALDGIYPSRS